tara:strand:- start:3284 stop:4288 length:1005 start_codon:yes stop_codon:yes gene_type:complete
MINIIAVNIKQGGGLILLKLLVSSLIDKKSEITLHVDSKIGLDNFSENDFVKLKLYKNFISKVFVFGKSYDKSLYFGNIPPFFTKSRNNFLYLHNPFYTMSFSFLFKKRHWKFIIYKIYINFFIKNIKSVFVQTESYRQSVKKELKVDSELMPFFENLSKYAVKKEKKIYDFAYISLPNPNKNFELFFDSLKLLNQKLRNKIKIVLTIPKDEKKLIEKINEFENSNINILNMGKLSMKHVIELLNKTKTLVFPSTHETFGLPLVEACQLNTFVISANLPYVYDVINPSLTFDPYSKKDIANTMYMALNRELKSPEIVIKNNLNKLMKTLSHHEL